MRLSSRRFLAVALLGLITLFTSATPAQAALTLRLSGGGYSPRDTSDASSRSIEYSQNSFNTAFPGVFSIERSLNAESNSGVDGPGEPSQLSLGAFKIKNLTGLKQTLVISISDMGFLPDDMARPLWLENSGSATFYKNGGALKFQTFAFDGDALFKTTGPGVAWTDAINLVGRKPTSISDSSTAPFALSNAKFSLTSVMTIELEAGAIVGFNSFSLAHAPEPGTVTLALSGIPLLAVVALRRRRAVRAD